MALSNYGDLKTAVADTLNRQDLTSVIPNWIAFATAALNRRLIALGPVRQMLGTWSTTINAEFTALPTDFLGMKSVYLTPMSTSPRIQYAEPEKIDEQKIMRSTQDGDPQLFTIDGTNLQTWPYNGGTYTASNRYWKSLTPFSADGDTNWLLTQHPDIYLHTALTFSAPYLKDDDRVQTWGALASTAIDDLVTADRIARQSTQESAPILPFDPP